MEMNTQDQLKLIEEMISQSKNKISEGSIFYLIWGWLVIIAAAFNYYMLTIEHSNYHWIAWPILMTLGGIISGVVGIRKERSSQVKTYVDRALSYLWIGFTISLFMILVSMVKYGAQTVYPIIILLYGLGTFVSGGILKFKPLIWGGILCWILGAIAVYADFSQQLLLLMGAVLFSYILPGYLLSKSDKNV